MVRASAAAARKIEFIGDSITCGYGNLGTPPCDFTPDTEDVQQVSLLCELVAQFVCRLTLPTPRETSMLMPITLPGLFFFGFHRRLCCWQEW